MAYTTGDEIVFQHAGLLAGRVERMTTDGCRARYEVSAVLTFDVPEAAVIGLESEVLGETDEQGERASGGR